jgi:hypothetical protein
VKINWRQLFLTLNACLLLTCLAAAARAQSKSPLSSSSARNIIRRVAGIELPSSAVRVKQVSSPDKSTVDVLAQIETAFRFVKEQEQWRVAEIRTGNNQWEETALILHALKLEETAGACAELNSVVVQSGDVDPSVQLARCLIAQLAGIELPSDAVRVKSVSPLSLPFSNAPSALIVAQVEMEFRLLKGTGGKWRVAQIKTGGNLWADVGLLANGVDEQKKARALDELEMVATALEAFRRERGFYVEAESEAAIVDQLNPRYLRRIIRVDPWHKPYQYEGTRNSYTLRSNGADGQPNTSDDIVRRSN